MMEKAKKQKFERQMDKSPVELVLRDLNVHLQEYLAALRAVTDNREYHHLTR